MSEGIVCAVFFCVFSVFSIKKKKKEIFLTQKQKCAEKTRRERSEYHAEKPRKKCVKCKYGFIT